MLPAARDYICVALKESQHLRCCRLWRFQWRRSTGVARRDHQPSRGTSQDQCHPALVGSWLGLKMEEARCKIPLTSARQHIILCWTMLCERISCTVNRGNRYSSIDTGIPGVGSTPPQFQLMRVRRKCSIDEWNRHGIPTTNSFGTMKLRGNYTRHYGLSFRPRTTATLRES